MPPDAGTSDPHSSVLRRGDHVDLLFYVGVHHKTGSVWMKRMHEAIGRRLGLPLIELDRPRASIGSRNSSARTVAAAVLEATMQSITAHPRGILFDRHSSYGEALKQIPRIRGVHIIRDPRDVLISASFYHLRSHESWLHQPFPHFDGMTYQEKLRSVGTIREALVFELKHQTRRAIHEMAAFPKLATVPTVRYESLMVGDVMAEFEAMFSSLGFSGRALAVALECAKRESIVLNPVPRRSPHVRSGEPQQWRHTFDRDLGEQFVTEAGDQLVALGYEPDDSWLRKLPSSRPALDATLPVQTGEPGFDGTSN